jgi:hypothetical protein
VVSHNGRLSGTIQREKGNLNEGMIIYILYSFSSPHVHAFRPSANTRQTTANNGSKPKLSRETKNVSLAGKSKAVVSSGNKNGSNK